jgi:transcriptional regulator with XRE-family HTH domain
MILMDMAEELGISIAQLSAIELGKRSVSQDMSEKLITLYASHCSGEEEMQRLIDISQPSFKEDFGNTPELQRELFVSFARAYKAMPDEEAQSWLTTLNEMNMKHN